MNKIICRKGCGACCIAPSISSAIPGMLSGKPAGIRCPQLTAENLCSIFDSAERPDVCGSYQASVEYCGGDRDEAILRLNELECRTAVPEPHKLL